MNSNQLLAAIIITVRTACEVANVIYMRVLSAVRPAVEMGVWTTLCGWLALSVATAALHHQVITLVQLGPARTKDSKYKSTVHPSTTVDEFTVDQLLLAE